MPAGCFHSFVFSCLAALAVLFAFNVVIGLQAKRFPAQQLLQRIENSATGAKYVFLGDSMMEADADPRAFNEGCAARGGEGVSANFALGSTKASEHCLVLEHLLARTSALKTVFYGFYDELLTEPVPARWQDLGGNRALSFRFPRRAAELLYPDDAFRRWQLQVLARVPMFTERLAIWARVERMRRRLAAIGLPAEAASRFGRVVDFATFEPTDIPAFEARLVTTAREERPFNRPLEEMFRICAARGVRVFILIMPVPNRHRERFYSTEAWRIYRGYLQEQLAARGVTCIDASEWVADGDFFDALHVNERGARVFSKRLAQEVCGMDRAISQE